EPAQPLQHVLRPADRLAELAVAHHVDAGLRLAPHHGGDRIGEALVVGRLVERLAALPGAEELLQRVRADQAADMGGENARGAAFHGGSLSAGCGGDNRFTPRKVGTCPAGTRHCEERSDEAISAKYACAREAGLLRFARNDSALLLLQL